MLEILQSDFGVFGDALQWFRSYLSERKQHVIVNQQYNSLESLMLIVAFLKEVV